MLVVVCIFFFFNDTATTEIYTLSLHDALPIRRHRQGCGRHRQLPMGEAEAVVAGRQRPAVGRSEEHTSDLQSHVNLVCRLLLEKKKNKTIKIHNTKQNNQEQKHTQ